MTETLNTSDENTEVKQTEGSRKISNLNLGKIIFHLDDLDTLVKTLPRRNKVEITPHIDAIRRLLK